MALNIAPLYVFFTINIIILRLTDPSHEAVPHMATNDDEYDGYYIPKGTIVFGSSWLV